MIFNDFNKYKKSLREIYGETNEKQESIRIIIGLKMKGLYPDYQATFQ